ncbi:tRNA-dihydrouridine synthase [Kineococcus glutinatus]|uniref:Uncharacterized protein n=1 Tax=Kineococcus glutinatus TaxID=1070872 RepID=A0ABP9H834_9ACTN
MQAQRPVRRRSAVVTLSVTGVLAAAGLAACGGPDGSDDPDYRAVCVDERSRERLPDEDCDDDRSGGWWYLGRGGVAPAVGQRVGGGTAQPPEGARVVRGGVPAEGATITRGGLGGGSDSGVGG